MGRQTYYERNPVRSREGIRQLDAMVKPTITIELYDQANNRHVFNIPTKAQKKQYDNMITYTWTDPDDGEKKELNISLYGVTVFYVRRPA